MQQKRCALCGTDFGCGALEVDCWCSTVPALPSEQLRPVFDCLCPHCLRRTSDQADSRTGAVDGITADPDPAR